MIAPSERHTVARRAVWKMFPMASLVDGLVGKGSFLIVLVPAFSVRCPE
jgi:hypothetical protein